MKRLQSNAVLLSLIDNLQAKGSWCGETHVQKATYFIQELFGVPSFWCWKKVCNWQVVEVDL